MTLVLTGTLSLVAGVLLLPLLSDLFSLAASARPSRRARGAAGDAAARSRLLVLAPAHDEALLIGECVRSLLAMDRRRTDADVVVLADNCADATGDIAEAAGARVLRRDDPALRGKPHAIQWALGQLPLDRYDAVVIIDADTVVDPRFADELAAHAPLREKGVQAYFGLSNERDSWLSLLAGLLARVRYEGQYPAKARAGLNCPLTGNGMCLGTGLLARRGWAPDSLTENWELYARYTAHGETIAFAPGALLYSQEARTMSQGATQRRRWQAGRWIALRDHWRGLIGSRRIGVHQKIDALAELSSPGPVLGATIAIAGIVVASLLPGTGARVVAAAFLLSLLPMTMWTLAAFVRHPRRGALALAFLRLPLYMFWRVAVAALAILTGSRGGWHRSPRHSPETT